MLAILATLVGAGRNIIVALLTKTFGVWLLKQAAKSSKTMIDDNAVALLEAGLDNDQEAIVAATKALTLSIKDEL